ncbi:hypothetical protein BaRGS_00030940 [Batillaria attramentaria]|uniref:Uncharacterized protein n=1 Tax=Batillaria attramentaria TaxID=370345 RepID=A0ABD0JRY7_9CAEN
MAADLLKRLRDGGFKGLNKSIAAMALKERSDHVIHWQGQAALDDPRLHSFRKLMLGTHKGREQIFVFFKSPNDAHDESLPLVVYDCMTPLGIKNLGLAIVEQDFNSHWRTDKHPLKHPSAA